MATSSDLSIFIVGKLMFVFMRHVIASKFMYECVLRILKLPTLNTSQLLSEQREHRKIVGIKEWWANIVKADNVEIGGYCDDE